MYIGDAAVVAEEVIGGAQVVFAAHCSGLVVGGDPVVGVGVRRAVHEMSEREDIEVGAVDNAVHEVHVELFGMCADGRPIGFHIGVAFVHDADDGLGRNELELEFAEDPLCAERAVDRMVDKAQVIFGRATEHIACGGDNIILDARVVESAVAKGHGLDRAAGNGPSDGDRFEFGHHDGYKAKRQCGAHQVDKGHARFGRASATFHVDCQYPVQTGDVDLVVGVLLIPRFGNLMACDLFAKDSGRVLLRSRSSRAMRATSESCCSRVTVLNFIITIFPFCTEDDDERAELKIPLAIAFLVIYFLSDNFSVNGYRLNTFLFHH